MNKLSKLYKLQELVLQANLSQDHERCTYFNLIISCITSLIFEEKETILRDSYKDGLQEALATIKCAFDDNEDKNEGITRASAHSAIN